MRSERAALIIVGAGPAGLCAAIGAAGVGIDVIVIDENARVGGQIYRQMPSEFVTKDAPRLGVEHRDGQSLFAKMQGLPIRLLLNTTVWGTFDRLTLDVVDSHEAFRISGDAIVLATGAYDRPIPIPGWTLPGVLTVGGIQTLLKAQRMIAGRRILFAGTGPLQLVVASQLAKAGANIVAVCDPVSTRALIPHARSLLKAWNITRSGLGYRWNLLRRRIPWIPRSVVTRIDGNAEVSSATIASVNDSWEPIPGTERIFQVDTVCLGYGLLPSVELTRLCGCKLRHETDTDAWLPERDSNFQTTIPGVYAIGDGAGVAGVAVAREEGAVAGLAVAHALHRISENQFLAAAAASRRQLERLAAFRAVMDSVYRPRPGLYRLATQDTIVCRCEEICLAEINSAIDDGAETLAQVKAWTRAGMGACQGRMCSSSVAHLVSCRTGKSPEAVGMHTALVPAKPIAVQALLKSIESI